MLIFLPPQVPQQTEVWWLCEQKKQKKKSCFKSSRDIQGCKYSLGESDEWKRSLINLKVHVNIKTSPDKAGLRRCLTGGSGSPLPRSLHPDADGSCWVQIFGLVCYGWSVSLSKALLCCIAWINDKRGRRWRESRLQQRGSNGGMDQRTKMWTNETELFGWARLEGRSATLKITDVVCLLFDLGWFFFF